jgi:hypothetical protein
MTAFGVTEQLTGVQLSEIGFVPEGVSVRAMVRCSEGDGVMALTGPSLNANSNNVKILKAVLCAGLYPNVCRVVVDTKYQQTLSGTIPAPNLPRELVFKLKGNGRVTLSSAVYCTDNMLLLQSVSFCILDPSISVSQSSSLLFWYSARRFTPPSYISLTPR